MTKKEKAFIQSKIDQYRKGAKEEYARAKREPDKESRDEMYFQGRLNEDAADTLALLLCELEELSQKKGGQ